MLNFYKRFGGNSDGVLHQQIVVMMNAAAKRIFNWNDRTGNLSVFDSMKCFVKGLERSRFPKTESGYFTVCSRFALVCHQPVCHYFFL